MGKAVNRAVDQGLAVSVAAENSGLPAFTATPAGYKKPTTVTAMNPRNDQFAGFSNCSMGMPVIAAPLLLDPFPDELYRTNGRNMRAGGGSVSGVPGSDSEEPFYGAYECHLTPALIYVPLPT